MAHNGNEYQIKIICENGTEELSGWMNSTEQVAQAMTSVHESQSKTYWLLVRREEQIILECPITDMPPATIQSARLHYLVRARSRDRYPSSR
jgi:hypothetical protein